MMGRELRRGRFADRRGWSREGGGGGKGGKGPLRDELRSAASRPADQTGSTSTKQQLPQMSRFLERHELQHVCGRLGFPDSGVAAAAALTTHGRDRGRGGGQNNPYLVQVPGYFVGALL